jgi:hypothetical protein
MDLYFTKENKRKRGWIMSFAGRRTLLTKKIQDKIVSALSAGNYKEHAARYAGISERTLYGWLKRGEQFEEKGEPASDEKYFLFMQAVENAIASSIVEDVAIIRKAGNKHWQARAWMLERRAPKEWGRQERVEMTGKDGGPIEISAREKLDQKLASMSRGTDERDN